MGLSTTIDACLIIDRLLLSILSDQVHLASVLAIIIPFTSM